MVVPECKDDPWCSGTIGTVSIVAGNKVCSGEQIMTLDTHLRIRQVDGEGCELLGLRLEDERMLVRARTRRRGRTVEVELGEGLIGSISIGEEGELTTRDDRWVVIAATSVVDARTLRVVLSEDRSINGDDDTSSATFEVTLNEEAPATFAHPALQQRALRIGASGPLSRIAA